MKFWIDTYGCAKNQVDAEELASRLEHAGHEWVSTAALADLIIVNTCGFIEPAKKESIGAIMSLRAACPDKKILVAGCLAQRYAEELSSDMAEADGILGNVDLSRIVEAAEATIHGDRPTIVQPSSEAGPELYEKPVVLRSRLLDYPGTAHLKVTEGCSNHCSFCAIPLIRGPLRSRRIDDILGEAGSLLDRGIKELVLIGQDLGSYGKDFPRTSAALQAGVSTGSDDGRVLPELLAGLDSLRPDPDYRVRVLYIHPDHVPERLVETIATSRHLIPYFDIPFQHASTRILRAMNRRGDAATYLELIRSIRSRFEGRCMLRSTFLTGFPGETEADFQELRAFQDEACLDWVGTFPWSREEGTPAYSMKSRVPKKVAQDRQARIQSAQIPITAARLATFIGTECDILIEEVIEGEELSIGRGWMQAPEVDGLTVVRGHYHPGTLLPCRIVTVNGVDLEAVAVRRSASAERDSEAQVLRNPSSI